MCFYWIPGTSAEEALWFFTLFLFGLVTGSFLNVCIYRLPRNRSIIAPASFCPSCGAFVKWYDNVPLLSYLLLRGKCRSCKSPISLRYPLVEALTGLLFGLLFIQFVLKQEQSLSLYVAYTALSSALIVSSFIDLEFYLIPNEITMPGIIAGPIFSFLFPGIHYPVNHLGAPLTLDYSRMDALSASFTGILIGGGIVWLTAVIGSFVFRREAMGMGDVKLMAMIGGITGWKLALMVYFLAPFFALAAAVPLFFVGKGRKIPYAPFLSMATLAALFFQRPFTKFLDSRLFILSEVVKEIF